MWKDGSCGEELSKHAMLHMWWVWALTEKLSNGVELQDCLFVLGLMWTLISEPRIEMEGASMTSSKGIRKIFDSDGKLIISAHMHQHTYLLDRSTTPISYAETSNNATDARVTNTADLWHCRLGHLNYQDMVKLKQIATGIDFSGELSFCEHFFCNFFVKTS